MEGQWRDRWRGTDEGGGGNGDGSGGKDDGSALGGGTEISYTLLVISTDSSTET